MKVKNQEELEARGWKFREEESYHPHNRDTWIDLEYKSPRMEKFKTVYNADKVEECEATSLAYELLDSYVGKRLPIRLYEEYLLKNPEATEIPNDLLIINPKYQ